RHARQREGPRVPGLPRRDPAGPDRPADGAEDPGIGGARYRTVVVGERAELLATDTPLELQPAATFADVPNPWAVIVPGGGAAAPDMALPLLARLRGKAVARFGQLSAEYDPQPPFGRVGPDPADDELARMLRDPGSVSAADPGGGDEREIAFVLYPGLTV